MNGQGSEICSQKYMKEKNKIECVGFRKNVFQCHNGFIQDTKEASEMVIRGKTVDEVLTQKHFLI